MLLAVDGAILLVAGHTQSTRVKRINVAPIRPVTVPAPHSTKVAAPPTSTPTSKAAAQPAAKTQAAPSPQIIHTATEVAKFKVNTPYYATPGGNQQGIIPAEWYGAPSILPIIQQQPGWVQVRLAQRPDGSVGWVPLTGLSLSYTNYQIVVNLATTHLTLYDAGKTIMDVPVGIGEPQTPTPTGTYFVALFAPPATAGYGPFVMVTSAHSQAIQDWANSGTAIVAIHGTLGAGPTIATTGAPVSHGCVRLHISQMGPLRIVPPGSPISIIT